MKQFYKSRKKIMVPRKLSQNLSRRLLIGRWINIEACVPDGVSRQQWQGQITIRLNVW